MKAKILVFGLVVSLLAVLKVNVTQAASVAPIFVPGNPTCQELGYDFEAKIDPADPGVTVKNVGSLGSITMTLDGNDQFFDWTSTFGIDAVIAKGGPNANVYVYDPPAESFGDTGLASPINPNNNQPFGASHVSFCYDIELQVTKTANTTFDRDWDWTIDKVCDETALNLSPGQTHQVDCDVTVNASSTDSNWAVSGTINVFNPAPDTSATVTGVTDSISGFGVVAVNCSVTFPHVLPAGATLVCTYSTSLPDATSRTNTATATTTGPIDGDSGQADVVFGDPTTETDECINVVDDKFGNLGQHCAADGLSHVFSYTQTVGPYESPAQCGENEFVNTATFTTNDTQTTGSDNHTIVVTVPCVQGCTLTQGYWKTHSDRGPAPYDNNWANLGPLQEDTVFFLSGKTWYQVFWTAPKGNPYYNLAHQYMAARLNILNGASSTPAVDSALASATTFFNTFTPGSTLTKAQKANLLSLASTLDQYNNGLIGPGHCSEQQR